MLAERFVQGVDDGGGKAETWLVRHQGLWIVYQRPPDRQHLALLAGHGTSALVAPLRELRKNRLNPFQQRSYRRAVDERRRASRRWLSTLCCANTAYGVGGSLQDVARDNKPSK